jgi:predicted RNase H-like HicB family nuclease
VAKSQLDAKRKLMYRVGFPGWKLAAKFGLPIRLRVYITQDLEANVYVAESPDLEGLVIEGHTLDEVKDEALACSKILLEAALHNPAPETQTDFIWHSVQHTGA